MPRGAPAWCWRSPYILRAWPESCWIERGEVERNLAAGPRVLVRQGRGARGGAGGGGRVRVGSARLRALEHSGYIVREWGARSFCSCMRVVFLLKEETFGPFGYLPSVCSEDERPSTKGGLVLRLGKQFSDVGVFSPCSVADDIFN